MLELVDTSQPTILLIRQLIFLDAIQQHSRNIELHLKQIVCVRFTYYNMSASLLVVDQLHAETAKHLVLLQ